MPAQVPQYTDLMWPTLQAVMALGGSASIEELDEAVIEREGFSQELQEVLHGDGPRTEIRYRLAWARTYLKGMGLMSNSQRGVWSVTEKARGVVESEVRPLHAEFSAENRRKSAERRTSKSGQVNRKRAISVTELPDTTMAEGEAESNWKDTLLDIMLKMSPAGFEWLAQRLLREAGFASVKVTGKSSDGGIDGLGVYQVSLLSFPVFFQCKRYRGSVGSGAVRDFRGAMAGRGDKGLLITTGTFTSEARAESQRAGAPPIDLIDGDGLCDLLKEHAIGVVTTTRTVDDVTVEPAFFASLEPKID